MMWVRAISIMTRQRAGRPEFDSRWGQWRDISPRHRVQFGYGAHPASCSVGTGVLSPEL